MKLAITLKTAQGKPITKTSNDTMSMTCTNNRQQMFDIMFDGHQVHVMSYFGGRIYSIEYTDNPCGHALCSKDICGNDLPF